MPIGIAFSDSDFVMTTSEATLAAHQPVTPVATYVVQVTIDNSDLGTNTWYLKLYSRIGATASLQLARMYTFVVTGGIVYVNGVDCTAGSGNDFRFQSEPVTAVRSSLAAPDNISFKATMSCESGSGTALFPKVFIY